MKVVANVYEPMYDFNDKKYMRVLLSPNVAKKVSTIHDNKMHLLLNEHIDDPLDGRILKVKIPFRYRRVMCKVEGKPIQSLLKDDEVELEIDFKGAWNVDKYSGFSWVLVSCSA
jgi:hypothetical protein